MLSNGKKYIAIDLDGTLLSSKKSISFANIQSLKKARQAGYKMIVISGRHYSEIYAILNKYSLFNDFEYYISCDGQYIYSQQKLLKVFPLLTGHDIYKIFNFVNVPRIESYSDRNDLIIGTSCFDCLYNTLKKIIKKKGTYYIFPFMALLISNRIEKIFIDKLVSNEEIDSLKYLYTVHKKSDSNGKVIGIEILNKSVNKYAALKWLQEKNIIDLDELIYFGDDYNDEECFRYLRNSIIMGNAPKPLNNSHLFVTETNDNDGVALVLNNLLVNNN